jgi:uncharacterized iron-regulated membrane protein
LILGLYITVVCVSGSAVVFRTDLYDALPSRGFSTGTEPYDSVRIAYILLKWVSNLHGNLFLGAPGMTANAIGGALTAAVCVTGLVIWWPGVANWRRSLTVRRGVNWKRFMWDLHSAVGIWTFALLFMWGMTGFYFVFPQPFRAAIELFTPINPPRPAAALTPPIAQPPQAAPAQGGITQAATAQAKAAQGGSPQAGPAASAVSSGLSPQPFPRRRRRPLTLGQKILRGFSSAHYGDFGGWPTKVLWVILGFAPAVLYASALLMWWNRVVAPAMRRGRKQEEAVAVASERARPPGAAASERRSMRAAP